MVVIAPALVQSASVIRAEKTETSFSDDKLMNCQAFLANPAEMQQITKRDDDDDCTARNRGQEKLCPEGEADERL